MRGLLLLVLMLSANALGAQEELSENVRFVMRSLHLHADSCAVEFISEKRLPGSADQVIIVIPEYSWMDEDRDRSHFYLVGHLVVLNTTSKHLVHLSIENGEWYSDVMVLNEIIIDTAPYMVRKDKRAFGIRLVHHGASRANPYNTEHLSLFIQEGEILRPILTDFQTKSYYGEVSDGCYENQTQDESYLIIADESTNGFADILVKTNRSYSIYYVDDLGNCEETGCAVSFNQKLIYSEESYALRAFNGW